MCFLRRSELRKWVETMVNAADCFLDSDGHRAARPVLGGPQRKNNGLHRGAGIVLPGGRRCQCHRAQHARITERLIWRVSARNFESRECPRHTHKEKCQESIRTLAWGRVNSLLLAVVELEGVHPCIPVRAI